MAQFQYNQFINKKLMLFGIFPIKETVVVLITIFGLLMGSDLLTMFIPIPKWFFVIISAIVLVMYIQMMRRASKENHPSYLESFISSQFMQPRRFKIKNNRYTFDFYRERTEMNRQLKNNSMRIYQNKG